MRGRTLTFAVLIVSLAVLGAGCGGGAGDEATPTTTLEGTMTATLAPAATATLAADIRQQDLAGQPGLQSFLASAGGEVDQDRIIYVDLTEDGVEDAVVPVSSGGEGGDIAVFVFRYVDGAVEELLRATPANASLKASVSDGSLTITEPVFGPGDPLCCPSQLRTTIYRWDGAQLIVDRQETAPAEGN